MGLRRVIALACAWTAAVATAAVDPSAVTAADIHAACANLPAHPRLHVKGPAGLDALRAADCAEAVYLRGRVVATAESQLAKPLTAWKRVGRRLEGQDDATAAILACAAAYGFTGDARYAARARDEMLAMCAWDDWVPDHYLGVAEVLRGLAFGYDWTYGALTASERATIRKAVIDRGYGGMSVNNWWRKTDNNWGQVCWQGVTAAALAIYEDDAARSEKLLLEAVPALAKTTTVYAPKGAYPEGPGYWNYGTGRFVLALDQFEQALGTDFGLSARPGVLQTGEYLEAMNGPAGKRFNYSDCGDGITSYETALFYFARRAGRPDLLARARGVLANAVRAQNTAVSGVGALWTLLWCDFPLEERPCALPLDYYGDGANPVAALRENHADHGIYLGIKGGKPGYNHGHMDVGSFVLDMDGVRWAADLGSQNYNSIEQLGTIDLWGMGQDSTRWDVYRIGPHSHNLVTVDGARQQVSATAQIESVRSGDVSEARVDLSKVFGTAAVSSAVRTFTLDRPARTVAVRDDLAGLRAGADVRWAMMTPTGRTWVDGQTVHLAAKGARVDLVMSAEPAGTWELVDQTVPPHDWDAANGGYSQLRYHVAAPATGAVRLEARFVPAADWPAGATFYGLKTGTSAQDKEVAYGPLQGSIAWWSGPDAATATQAGVPSPWGAAGYGKCRFAVLSGSKTTSTGAFPGLPVSFGLPTKGMETLRFGGNITVTVPDGTFWGGRFDSNSAGLTAFDGDLKFMKTSVAHQFYASGITNDTRGVELRGRVTGAADVDLRFGATFCTGERLPARHRLTGDFSGYAGTVTTLTPSYGSKHHPTDQFMLLELESPSALGAASAPRTNALVLAHATRLRIADAVVQDGSRGISLATKAGESVDLFAAAGTNWTLRAPVYAAAGTLAKIGAGTVALAGPLHVPALAVTDGVARVAAPSVLRDCGKLALAGRGRLEVPAGLRAYVRALELDGVPQPAGVYGAAETAHVAGGGALVVGDDPLLGTDFSARTGFVALTWNGSAPGESPLNAATNIDVAYYGKNGTAKYFWSDREPVHAGTNYYVDASFRTFEPARVAAVYAFPGNALVAGPKASFQWKSFAPVRYDFAQDGVFLNGGAGWYINANHSKPVWVGGRMTLVGSSAANPVRIQPYGRDASYADGLGFRIDAALVGDAGQVLAVQGFAEAGLAASYPVPHSGYVDFRGDASVFAGTLAVASNRVASATDWPSVAAVRLANCAEFETAAPKGGEVFVRGMEVDGTSSVGCAPTNTLRVGTLRMADGTLRVHYDAASGRAGCVVVEDVWQASGKVRVAVDGVSSAQLDAASPRLPVLKVASRAGTFAAGLFEPGGPGTLALPYAKSEPLPGLPRAEYEVVREGGYTVLYVSWRAVVRQTQAITGYALAGNFNKGEFWSNGKTPAENAGRDFFCDVGTYVPGPGEGKVYAFPGASFSLYTNSLTFSTCGIFRFPRLDVSGGSVLRAWTGNSTHVVLEAPVQLHPHDGGAVHVLQGNGCSLELKGEVAGDVDCLVTIRKPDAKSYEPSTTFTPSGLNTNFLGRWKVCHNVASVANPTQYMNFVVSDARNLGGARAAFAYDALEIGDWQNLRVRGRVVLDEPTRGVSFAGNAQVEAGEGDELVLLSPVTWSGHVRKRGAGTLALGGPAAPRFGGAAQRAEPMPGTNVLELAAGALRPLSTRAVDGLAVVFGAGTRLQLDAATADAGLRGAGLYDVKEAAPFARAAGFAGTVPVDFGWTEADTPPATSDAFSVCTVRAAALPAARGLFAVVNPWTFRRVAYATRDNGDGSATLLAFLKARGLSFVLR